MEYLRGKRSCFMDRPTLLDLIGPHQRVHIDLGAGDGRYALHLARACPDQFVIGVDACRENLPRASRCASANALFVIANALDLPPELAGIASTASILFPWGSLLRGLLEADEGLIRGLRSLARDGLSLEIALNAGALEEQCWLLEDGASRVRGMLRDAGFGTGRAVSLNAAAIRRIPSTWAQRLAFGRDPRAVSFSAVFPPPTLGEGNRSRRPSPPLPKRGRGDALIDAHTIC